MSKFEIIDLVVGIGKAVKCGVVKVDGQVVDGSFALEQRQTVVIQAGKKAYAKININE